MPSSPNDKRQGQDYIHIVNEWASSLKDLNVTVRVCITIHFEYLNTITINHGEWFLFSISSL